MRKKIFISVIPIICIALLYGGRHVFLNHFYDDSYITYRFVQNFVANKGLVFNQGEYANSASAFTYTMLLAFFYDIGITNIELTSIVVSLLSVSGIAILLYFSIKKLTNSNLLAYFFSLMIPLHGLISGWALSGMETLFFSFLVLAFIYQYLFQKKNDAFLLITTLVLILLIRTEGIILLGVWGLSELYSVFIERKKSILQLVSKSLVYFVILASFYYFQAMYYGSLTTNAFEFKQIATYYQPNPFYIMLVWGGTSLILSLLAAYSLLIKRNAKTLFIGVYVAISFLALFIGPYSDGARYSVHLLPLVSILASVGFKRFIDSNNLKFIFITLLLITAQTIFSTFFVRHYVLAHRKGQECRREIGKYLSINLSENDYVLAGDIGMISYSAPNVKFIDLGGLTSSDVLTQYQNKQTIDKIILKKRPKLLADTFYNNDNRLSHPILENEVEFIRGMHTYTELPFKDTFDDIEFKCDDGSRTYAVVNLKDIYN